MSEIETNKNEQLWALMKSGDKSAFETIYIRYIDSLFNYGKKFTKEDTLIEDAIQELFIYLWKSRSKLSATNSIKAYLFVSLRRSIIKSLKEKGKYLLSDDNTNTFMGTELAIEDLMIRAELKSERGKKLKLALLSLSKRQQEVIYLKYTQSMDNKQIAEVLSINYQSVRNVLSTALKVLRSKIIVALWIIFSL